MLHLQRVGSHGIIMAKIKTVKRLRATMGGGFVARRVRNYNRGKGYGGTTGLCQTNAFQEKKYTHLGNKGYSSQDKEGVGAANKPKCDN